MKHVVTSLLTALVVAGCGSHGTGGNGLDGTQPARGPACGDLDHCPPDFPVCVKGQCRLECRFDQDCPDAPTDDTCEMQYCLAGHCDEGQWGEKVCVTDAQCAAGAPSNAQRFCDSTCRTVPPTCASTADCKIVSSTCQAGYCIIAPDPEKCTLDAHCPGVKCIDGLCQAPQVTCVLDSQCDAGEVCVGGCRPAASVTWALDECMVSATCPGGQYCQKTTGSPARCVTAWCESDADCPWAAACEVGVCVIVQPLDCEPWYGLPSEPVGPEVVEPGEPDVAPEIVETDDTPDTPDVPVEAQPGEVAGDTPVDTEPEALGEAATKYDVPVGIGSPCGASQPLCPTPLVCDQTWQICVQTCTTDADCRPAQCPATGVCVARADGLECVPVGGDTSGDLQYIPDPVPPCPMWGFDEVTFDQGGNAHTILAGYLGQGAGWFASTTIVLGDNRVNVGGGAEPPFTLHSSSRITLTIPGGVIAGEVVELGPTEVAIDPSHVAQCYLDQGSVLGEVVIQAADSEHVDGTFKLTMQEGCETGHLKLGLDNGWFHARRLPAGLADLPLAGDAWWQLK